MKEYFQEVQALTMRWVRRLSREKQQRKTKPGQSGGPRGHASCILTWLMNEKQSLNPWCRLPQLTRKPNSLSVQAGRVVFDNLDVLAETLGTVPAAVSLLPKPIAIPAETPEWKLGTYPRRAAPTYPSPSSVSSITQFLRPMKPIGAW